MERYAKPILAILAVHVDKSNAITARDIASKLELQGKYDDRRVRAIITELIDTQNEPIGASDGHPAGFFIFSSVDEWREYLASIVIDIGGSWKRYNKIAVIGRLRYGVPVKLVNPAQVVMGL